MKVVQRGSVESALLKTASRHAISAINYLFKDNLGREFVLGAE